MSNLFYMPLILKYGRRPVYLISFVIYGACALWAGRAETFGSHLAARLCLGFAGGSAECLAPLTIADTFFLHERAFVMVYGVAGLQGFSTMTDMNIVCTRPLSPVVSAWELSYLVLSASHKAGASSTTWLWE